MTIRAFDTTWERIVACAGQPFKTVTGKPFTYTVAGLTVRPSRGGRKLSRSEFEKAWTLLPSATRSQLNSAIQGPSYIIAILTDARIRK